MEEGSWHQPVDARRHKAFGRVLPSSSAATARDGSNKLDATAEENAPDAINPASAVNFMDVDEDFMLPHLIPCIIRSSVDYSNALSGEFLFL